MKARIATLYLFGLIQGISFTLIPGASAFLTSSQGFHLTPKEYGQLFIPMISMAILSSLFGGAIAKKWGIRRVTVLSGILNLLSMLVFAFSSNYTLLLLALFFLGAGFGANLSTLNSYILEFFPTKPSAALTALHAFLGIGTAIGPIFFQLALHLMKWWIAPLILAFIYILLTLSAEKFFPPSLQLPKSTSGALKPAVWLFAAIAILYGICETAFGNWGILFLKTERGIPSVEASFSLSLFWGTVTIGRLIFSAIAIRISPYLIYATIGPILIAALLLLDLTPLDFASFAIAGFGCSAFLPLTVSLGQRQDLPHAEMISGLLIALYMAGYGLTAYGIGFLETDFHFSLGSLFLWLLIPASALSLLSWFAGAIRTS